MRIIVMICCCIMGASAQAQELYIYSEPASNMAKGSVGVRMTNRLFKLNGFKNEWAYRLEPEIMFGLSRKWMFHLNAFASSVYLQKFRVEGGGFYAKYRFFSEDEVHSHFRMAAFAKASVISNPEYYRRNITLPGNPTITWKVGYIRAELNLDGNNSGWQAGVVATKLQNKLAVSASVSYLDALRNVGFEKPAETPGEAINYSLSAGYLLFPKEYVSYNQVNMNLYTEITGQTLLGKKGTFIDINPAIQFIIKSVARLDLGTSIMTGNNTERVFKNSFLLRFEYNFFNVKGSKGKK